MQDEKEKGRVVYSRLEGAGEEESARARKGAGGGFAAALLAHDSLWKALLPLFVGFAMLVGLVFGLGYESARKVKDARYSTQREERALFEMENHLLNLRLELSKLDTEARISGRIEAGTQDVMLPPKELRLRKERDAVAKPLPEFDRHPIRGTGREQEARGLLH